MDWINIHDRLPRDGQRVLVWYWDDWEEAKYSKPRNQFHWGSRVIENVQYWAEVKMPGEE